MADAIEAAMTVGLDFAVAAASYFGLDPDFLLEGSGVDGTATAGGALRLTLVVALRPVDVAGIAARMQELADAAAAMSARATEEADIFNGKVTSDGGYMWLADSYVTSEQKEDGHRRVGRFTRVPAECLTPAQHALAQYPAG